MRTHRRCSGRNCRLCLRRVWCVVGHPVNSDGPKAQGFDNPETPPPSRKLLTPCGSQIGVIGFWWRKGFSLRAACGPQAREARRGWTPTSLLGEFCPQLPPVPPCRPRSCCGAPQSPPKTWRGWRWLLAAGWRGNWVERPRRSSTKRPSLGPSGVYIPRKMHAFLSYEQHGVPSRMYAGVQSEAEGKWPSPGNAHLKSVVTVPGGEMLPLNNMMTVSPNPQIAGRQELDRNDSKEQLTALGREELNPEAFRKSFRGFPYPEKAGPREAVSQLWELCLQWLRPEIHTKEQILELLVLEQFLTILPSEIRIWVKSQHPENIEEVVTLVEDLTQMLEEEVPSSQDCPLQEGSLEKEGMSAVLPIASFQETITFQDVVPDFTWEEWTQLDPGQQDLCRDVLTENYRNLIFIGLSVSRPDVFSQLEHGEVPWLLKNEASRDICPYWDIGPEVEFIPMWGTTIDESSQETLMERTMGHNSWDSRLEEAFKCYGSLMRYQGHQERLNLKQVTITHEETLSMERDSEKSEFGGCFSLSSILITQQRVPIVNQSINSHLLGAYYVPGTVLGIGNTNKINETIPNPYSFDTHGKSFQDNSELNKCQKIYTGNYRLMYNEFGEAFSQISQFNLQHAGHSGEKPYKCSECGKAFTQRASLTQHQRIHSGEKPFKCNECGKAFTQRAHLTQHLFTHNGEKPFKCYQCGKAFIQISQLNIHQRIHSGVRSYICNDCGKAFTQRTNLTQHQRIHSGEKPFKCNECGKAFTQRAHLTQHMFTHSGSKPFKCNECGKAYSQLSQLNVHRRIHSGEKSYKCNECSKVFPMWAELTRHLRTHSGEKPYKCNECGKAFTQRASLTQHHRIHSGEKPYKCNECGKAFTKRAHLTQHQFTHSGEKPFKCNECGKAYGQFSQLNIHLRIHSGERSYKCNECGKAFTQRASLTQHQRIHSGEKPYKCNECGKAFTQRAHLTQHQFTHNGEKHFKCNECGKAYSQISQLNIHRRIHSGEKSYKCNECEKIFPKWADLNRHQRIHSGEKPYKCNECEKAFTQRAHLSRHLLTHSGEKPFKCSDCGKAFTQRAYALQHQRIHLGEKCLTPSRSLINICELK
ncbi:uncharacterized protein LOC141550319 isoform X2 [Sminthopsis crassicaudata]|uniref:uncharacterized protein LOC141550319 isoform X2 n=1 Tax=Sminthopsis crassicaudata TaxID=9301 RepID=UPI003D695CB7